MFRDEFYFEYSEGDVGLAMRMWGRESLQYSFIFAVLFPELLHLILFEEKILLGERKKMYGRGVGAGAGVVEKTFQCGFFSIDFHQGVVLY